MKTVPVDKIITSVPLNRTAARVINQTGEHYDPKVNYHEVLHFENRPPLRDLSEYRKEHQETYQTIIGRRFGRFVVVGILAGANRKRKTAAWVCRCDCGHYEVRNARVIKNPNNIMDRCQNCWHEYRAQQRFAKKGSKPLAMFTKPAQ
jgi:predicted SprT family Zn-dependent metalloprotease